MAGIALWNRQRLPCCCCCLTGNENLGIDSSNWKITKNWKIMKSFGTCQKCNNIIRVQDIFWLAIDQSVKWQVKCLAWLLWVKEWAVDPV